MSRRQYTTLKLLVSLPLPAGLTQKEALTLFTAAVHSLKEKDNGGFPTHQATVKQVGKEVTYL